MCNKLCGNRSQKLNKNDPNIANLGAKNMKQFDKRIFRSGADHEQSLKVFKALEPDAIMWDNLLFSKTDQSRR